MAACASTGKLACAAASKFRRIRVKVADCVVSLGTGLGVGVRQNVKQLSKRLRAFVARRARFKRLRATGVRTDRLLRTGGNAAKVFGQRPIGVSDSMLLVKGEPRCCSLSVHLLCRFRQI